MLLIWLSFIVFVLVMLSLDLFVVNRHAHEVRSREALLWTGFNVLLALGFTIFVYFAYDHNWGGIANHLILEQADHPGSHGREAAAQYIAGWLTEYSLSLDNIFVIAVIFRYFAVPPKQQRRVLLWGVLGALVMRGAMIGLGAVLLARFHWTIYILGGLLLFTAARMLFSGDEEPHPDRNVVVRAARRLYPVTGRYEEDRFFTRLDGRRALTPLAIVLLVVETTDVLFAVDSIPAIFAITTDPFLVFTSNVFAILGLRSLYFALAAVIDRFRYLKASLVFVLAFVGVKMILTDVQHISTEMSLGIILGILAVGIGASLLASAQERQRKHRPPPVSDLADAAEVAWRRSRRILILIAGATVIIMGLAIGTLPGPGGIPIVLGGLAILATEFVWARRLLQKAREKAQAALEKQGPWVTILGAAMVAAAVATLFLHGHWHIRAWWSIPLFASGGSIIATEIVYNRFRRRRLARAQGQSRIEGAAPPSEPNSAGQQTRG